MLRDQKATGHRNQRPVGLPTLGQDRQRTARYVIPIEGLVIGGVVDTDEEHAGSVGAPNGTTYALGGIRGQVDGLCRFEGSDVEVGEGPGDGVHAQLGALDFRIAQRRVGHQGQETRAFRRPDHSAHGTFEALEDHFVRGGIHRTRQEGSSLPPVQATIRHPSEALACAADPAGVSALAERPEERPGAAL